VISNHQIQKEGLKMRKTLAFLVAFGLVFSLSVNVWGHFPEGFTYYAVQFWGLYLPDAYIAPAEDMYEQLAGLNESGTGADVTDLALGSYSGSNDSTDLTEEDKPLSGAESTQYILAEPPVQDVGFMSGNVSTWDVEFDDSFDVIMDIDHSGPGFTGDVWIY